MDYLSPHMFDVSNIDMWKLRMSTYLKTLALHVFLATIKKSFLGNNKHIEANAQVLGHLDTLLAKNIYLWFLIVIPFLQCGTH